MNAPQQLVVPAIGSQLAGGTCLAHVFVNAAPFSLIVPPKAVRDHAGLAWSKKNRRRVDGALSYFDGLANTRAMAAIGSEAATFARDQRIEGFDDWFIASRQDMLAIRGNVAAAGPAYAADGAEAIEPGWYWSSTQFEFDDGCAWLQKFGGNGDQDTDHKSNEYRVFVLRRQPIL